MARWLRNVLSVVGLVAFITLAFGSSSPPPAAPADPAADAAAAAQRLKVAAEARERAVKKLSTMTDWTDSMASASVCLETIVTELPPDLKSRCATAHLAATRAFLKSGQVVDARKALSAATAAGASQGALVPITKLVTAAEDANAKKQRASDAAAEAAVRLKYGKTLRQHYLDENLDIKVSVTGQRNDRLKMQFVLFNDVWTNKFQKGDLLDEIRKLGFRRVELTDGYDYSVYWDFK